MFPYYRKNMIGQAWIGTHVLLIQCNLHSNFVTSVHKSLHAPIELIQKNCAETLSQHISIGYKLIHTTYIPPNQIEYFLIL
ncbi:hypothetical protein [Metabacillus fastidiosus]|uniref:hypothetical protein n=1 Tax=Metabacillus fastidiosus TaxID=1458 RepID=UPI003D2E41B5